MNLWYPSSLQPVNNLNSNNYINEQQRVREDNQTHARIDHKFSDSNSFFGRFSWSDIYQRDPQNLPNAFQGTYNKYLGVTLSDTHVLQPDGDLEVRLGYLRANLAGTAAQVHQGVSRTRA